MATSSHEAFKTHEFGKKFSHYQSRYFGVEIRRFGNMSCLHQQDRCGKEPPVAYTITRGVLHCAEMRKSHA
jgi:hypothetical protein